MSFPDFPPAEEFRVVRHLALEGAIPPERQEELALLLGGYGLRLVQRDSVESPIEIPGHPVIDIFEVNESRPAGLQSIAQAVESLRALDVVRKGVQSGWEADDESAEGEQRTLYKGFWHGIEELQLTDPRFVDDFASTLAGSPWTEDRVRAPAALQISQMPKQWYAQDEIMADPRWERLLQDDDPKCRQMAREHLEEWAELMVLDDHHGQTARFIELIDYIERMVNRNVRD
ncbi:hypothetical protein [Streptacidiphilus sp. PAMC 29251]